MARRFLLLDRDGTLNVEKDYLSDPEQLVLIPGAGAALRKLRYAGFGLVVLTNQSGLARGYFTLAQIEAVHQRLHQLLAHEGVGVDGIYLCPHGPQEDCRCRKPRPGLVEQAVVAHGFDPALAIMIGDKSADVELGKAVGAVSILVRTGYGRESEAKGVKADVVLDALPEAADWILGKPTP